MRFVISCFLLFYIQLAYSRNDSLNCSINFHFSNYTNTDYIYIGEKEALFEIEFDTFKSPVFTKSFYVNDSLPKHNFIIINNDIEKGLAMTGLNFLVLHKGHFDVFIDIGKHQVKFENTDLNREYQYESKIRDSLRSITAFPIYKAMRLEKDQRKLDSLECIWKNEEFKISKYFYKLYLKNPNIYTALEFISSKASPFANKQFSKKELVKLFNKLNPALKQYKLYNDCLIALKNYNYKIKQAPTVKPTKTNLPKYF